MSKTKPKERRYGGADRICDARAEKFMLLIMVGRNTGSDANDTLIERKIRACSQGMGLDKVLILSEDTRRA